MHRSRNVVLALLVASGFSIFAREASARTMEAGTLTIGGGVGPSFKLGSNLGMSTGYLMLNGTVEYAFTRQWSAIGGLALGLAGTVPIKVRAGGRYRIIGGELPISPFVQAELSAGRMYDVLGANLTSIGARFGGGADYFLTATWSVGVLGAIEWATTTGIRPAGYSQLDVLLTVGHTF